MLSNKAVEAAVILEIDVANPAAVTFTGLAVNADVNATNSTSNGVSVIGFFTGNSTTTPGVVSVDAGSLGVLNDNVAGGTRHALDDYAIGAFAGGWTDDDIYFAPSLIVSSIWARTDTQALNGSLTLDLSAYTLPGAGHSGNVIIAPPNMASVIGQYSVVNSSAIPEPSSLLLLGLVGVAAGGWTGYRRLMAPKEQTEDLTTPA